MFESRKNFTDAGYTRDTDRDLRANWFYVKKVLPSLSESITQMREAADNNFFDKARELFLCWAGENRDFPILKKARERANTSPINENNYDWVKVGIIEITTIWHGAINRHFANGKVGKDAAHQNYKFVQNIYETLDINSVRDQNLAGIEVNWNEMIDNLNSTSESLFNK